MNLEIRNQGPDKAEVWIYDVIGTDMWGEGIAAKTFVKDLAALDVSQIDLHVNSPGGSVWDGQAIYNAIARHPANVTTYVDGLAASIASTIALAGDTVIMAENALMMIHKAWALSIGNANDLREAADVLDKVDETITGIYSRKTGKDAESIGSAMAEETWFTAQEAVDFGLADQVEEGLAAAALITDPEIMARYKHVPEALTKQDPDPIQTVAVLGDDIVSDSTGAVEFDSDGASQTSEVYDFALERIKHRRK